MSAIICWPNNRRAGDWRRPLAGFVLALAIGAFCVLASAPPARAQSEPLPPPGGPPAAAEPADEDLIDNPDQGAGWQMPGIAPRKRKAPDFLPIEEQEPLGEDALDNPDQGAGWQMPASKSR